MRSAPGARATLAGQSIAGECAARPQSSESELQRSQTNGAPPRAYRVAESFFATLRAELVDDERYASRHSAETSIGDYIESLYNVERVHSHLDYVSPIEFELKAQVNAIAA